MTALLTPVFVTPDLDHQRDARFAHLRLQLFGSIPEWQETQRGLNTPAWKKARVISIVQDFHAIRVALSTPAAMANEMSFAAFLGLLQEQQRWMLAQGQWERRKQWQRRRRLLV